MLRTRPVVPLWYLCCDFFGAQHCFICELQHLTQMHLDFLTNDVIKIQTNQGCHTSQIGHVLHFNNTNKIKKDLRFYITLNLNKGWVMEMHLTTFGNVIMWVSNNSKHLPIMCKFYNNLKHFVKPQNQTLSQACFQNPPRKWPYVS